MHKGKKILTRCNQNETALRFAARVRTAFDVLPACAASLAGQAPTPEEAQRVAEEACTYGLRWHTSF